MGNSPSTSSPVDSSHRLSKPPTNSSSSNLLILASHQSDNVQSSPVSTSAKSVDFEAVNTSQKGQRRSRQDTRQKLRIQLFGSEPDSPARVSLEDNNDRRNSLGSLVSGMKRLSRSGSTVSQNPSARGSATQLISLAGSRLSLVPEGVNADLDESEQRVLQEIIDKAEMAVWDEQAASASRRFSSIPEDDSSDVISPIRRRSLFTPGIATRGNDILRKPPPLEHLLTQADRDYYFNPHYSESSPLGKLAALDHAEDGRRSPVVRTETPCDLDVTQLGALKLGTLRIMNGAASPVPSEFTAHIRSGRSTPEVRRDDDYFTASEGLSSEEEGTGGPNQLSCSTAENTYLDVEVLYVPPRSAWKAMEKSRAVPARSGSPLKLQHTADSSDDELVITRTQPGRRSRPLSFVDCPGLSPGGATSIAQEYISELNHSSSDDASSIAKGYISELPTSPFSIESNPFANERSDIQVTSKASEYDDMLFEDEGISASSIYETDLSNLEPLQKSSTSTRDFAAYPESEKSQESGSTSTSASNDGRVLGKPLSKTDSGYSSSASLKSVRNAQSSRLIESTVSEPRCSASEKKLSLPDIGEDPNIHRKLIAQPRPTLPARSSLITKRNPKSQPTMRTTSSPRPSSESVQISVTASSNRSVSPAKPKKLQKPRPLSQPPPAKHITVQRYRELAQSHIPPVPSEIASKHAERLQQFPQLEHTYPSLNHTRSNETMSTSSIPAYVEIRFPSPANSGHENSDDRPLTAPRPPPHRDYSALRLFRSERRSSQQRTPGQVGLIAGISNFGDINESLGRSPYEVARSSLPAASTPALRPTSTHFQPRESVAPRSKTFTGMGAQEAADLARLRSKTLAERQQLPFALQQKLFDDRGGTPGKQPRPKSFVADTPPVPSLSGPRDHAEDSRLRASGTGVESRLLRPLPQPPSSEARPAPAKLTKAPPFEQPNPMPAKSSHTAAIEFHKSWEPRRQAWRQRRKSAGEGLLTRRSVSRELNQSPPQPSSFTSATATVAQSFRASLINVPTPPPHTITPSPSPGPGRYDGGLGFGFEPGYGVGGSAGTRSLQSDASRKGVDMSMGYGIDLSDVPIIAGLKRC